MNKILLLCALSLGLAAANPQERTAPVLSIDSRADVGFVDVTVTDRRERPVTNMAREDIDSVTETVVDMCESNPICGGCLSVLDQVVGVAQAYAESRLLWLPGIPDRLSTVVTRVATRPGRNVSPFGGRCVRRHGEVASKFTRQALLLSWSVFASDPRTGEDSR